MTTEETVKKVRELLASVTDRPIVVIMGHEVGVVTLGNCAGSMPNHDWVLLKAFHQGLENYARGVGNPQGDASRN